tara:strand:- start:129 stop:755 length:627 start_codon:yes stop_codon:yes gene_type:complete
MATALKQRQQQMRVFYRDTFGIVYKNDSAACLGGYPCPCIEGTQGFAYTLDQRTSHVDDSDMKIILRMFEDKVETIARKDRTPQTLGYLVERLWLLRHRTNKAYAEERQKFFDAADRAKSKSKSKSKSIHDAEDDSEAEDDSDSDDAAENAPLSRRRKAYGAFRIPKKPEKRPPSPARDPRDPRERPDKRRRVNGHGLVVAGGPGMKF